MRKCLFILAFIISAFANAATYTNPILPGFYPDPSICRVGQDYYLVNSSFCYFPGVPLFHSTDLVNWQQIGNVLDREEQLPLKGATPWLGIYAPTIRYHEGIFYMITTNVGNGGNFFVTATDPRGPWSNPIWLKQGGIDPSLFWEDGRCYMCSNPDDGIWLCEIDDKTGEQLTDSRLLWRGDGGRYPEAPHIYKKDGYYYLMIAEGGTEMGHSETIARSRNIYGPYESNPNNPILCHQRQQTQGSPIQGTGHADLVEAPDGKWWLVCLAFRPQGGLHILGRETFLAPVEWKDGWPVVNGNGTVPDTIPSTCSRTNTIQNSQNHSAPFITIQNTFQWLYLRNPHKENYQFKDGNLIMKGGCALEDENDSPSFYGLRQTAFDFTLTTDVKPENGCQAGLTVFMKEDGHYDLLYDGENILLTYRLGRILHTAAKVKYPDSKGIRLKIVGNKDCYTFYYAEINTDDWHQLDAVDTRFISTETIGGFTGVILALHAKGDGQNSATFSKYNLTNN